MFEVIIGAVSGHGGLQDVREVHLLWTLDGSASFCCSLVSCM